MVQKDGKLRWNYATVQENKQWIERMKVEDVVGEIRYSFVFYFNDLTNPWHVLGGIIQNLFRLLALRYCNDKNST